MNDSYQAIYDAVRSRISGGNIGDIVREVAAQAFDISHQRTFIADDFRAVAMEMQRPSAIYRPTIAPDGSKWCALYGPNLMKGVCGFGDTPEEAARDFDLNWLNQKTPQAIRRVRESA